MLQVILLFWGILGTCRGKSKKNVLSVFSVFELFCHPFLNVSIIFVILFLDQHTDFIYFICKILTWNQLILIWRRFVKKSELISISWPYRVVAK